MKMNTAGKMLMGAGISAAIFAMAPSIQNMVMNKTNNMSMFNGSTRNSL